MKVTKRNLSESDFCSMTSTKGLYDSSCVLLKTGASISSSIDTINLVTIGDGNSWKVLDYKPDNQCSDAEMDSDKSDVNLPVNISTGKGNIRKRIVAKTSSNETNTEEPDTELKDKADNLISTHNEMGFCSDSFQSRCGSTRNRQTNKDKMSRSNPEYTPLSEDNGSCSRDKSRRLSLRLPGKNSTPTRRRSCDSPVDSGFGSDVELAIVSSVLPFCETTISEQEGGEVICPPSPMAEVLFYLSSNSSSLDNADLSSDDCDDFIEYDGKNSETEQSSENEQEETNDNTGKQLATDQTVIKNYRNKDKQQRNMRRLVRGYIAGLLPFKFEVAPGWCVPRWIPMKWLEEPEVFLEERRHIRTRNRIHKHADSLFSTTSGFSDFRGFFNLAVFLLVLSCARVALENVIKYGILVNPAAFLPLFFTNPYSFPSLSLVVVCNVFIFITLFVEKILAAGSISEGFGFFLNFLNISLQILIPCYAILVVHPNPVFSSVTLLINTIVFLKLISYVQTNKWCREDSSRHRKNTSISRNRHKSLSVAKGVSMEEYFQNGDVKLKRYPDNLTVSDMYYFMFAPTLCYELDFPRSARVRKRFLLKRIAEVVFISGLILALIQQWVLPLVNNALVPFNQLILPKILERILKLALPNFCIWLLWFYSTFHSMFNVLAEVLMFGDRVFYHDWWNSETVAEFWQKWNIPVHRWATRHLYKPMMISGYTKMQSTMAVFIFSAVFHEVLVSIPLGIFRLYAFFGMALQVPLAILTAKLNPYSPVLCNVIVWGSLIIGQPIAVLMYYVDYYITTQT